MMVKEAMRAHVVTAGASASVHDIVDILDLYQVRCVPIVDDEKRLLGVVTEADVARLLLGGALADGSDPRALGDQRIGAIMSAPAWSVDENASLSEAARIMIDRQVARLPVTSAGHVIGIIGRVDICEAALGDSAPT